MILLEFIFQRRFQQIAIYWKRMRFDIGWYGGEMNKSTIAVGILALWAGMLIVQFLLPTHDEGFEAGVRATHIHVKLALAKKDSCYETGQSEIILAHIKEISKEKEEQE